jgi:ribonuclease P protein component
LQEEEQKEEKNLQFLTKEGLNSRVRYTFSRDERLKSKLILASLFEKGSFFVSKPLLFKYIIEDAELNSIQAGFSVPKKRFKRAVDRNRVKRLMREVHRLNQFIIKENFLENPKRIIILYIYAKNDIVLISDIEKAVLSFYARLVKP